MSIILHIFNYSLNLIFNNSDDEDKNENIDSEHIYDTCIMGENDIQYIKSKKRKNNSKEDVSIINDLIMNNSKEDVSIINDLIMNNSIEDNLESKDTLSDLRTNIIKKSISNGLTKSSSKTNLHENILSYQTQISENTHAISNHDCDTKIKFICYKCHKQIHTNCTIFMNNNHSYCKWCHY